MKKKQTVGQMRSIFVAVYFAAAFSVNAGTWQSLTYELSGNQIAITDCATSASGELVIPNNIDGFPVTAIGPQAFQSCTGLTSVTIPDSVTLIDEWAFLDCTGLTSLTIGNNVATINLGAFYRCSRLTSVTVPDRVTFIGEVAFYKCTGLMSVTIGDRVAIIDSGAFGVCSSLTTISVHAENAAFSGSDGILFNKDQSALLCWPAGKTGSYTIPAHVASIGVYAFEGCAGLTSVTIPDSVTWIGEGAFDGCTGLTSIVIPDGIESIGEDTFDGCTGLTSVTIPDSVTWIGSEAFENCTSLKNMTIPDAVRVIGDGAFINCYSLTSVMIPAGVTSIKDYAFQRCSGLTSVTVPNSVTNIGAGAFDECSRLTRVVIPDSVTSLGSTAFANCSSLKSISIPGSVISIGNYAFYRCFALETALFEGDAPEFFGSYYVFDSTASNFTIQFYQGASRFTTPTWKNYPCEIWSAEDHEFEAWATACPEGQRGATDTPDGDGIPNLIKYAAGLEPGSSHTSDDLFVCAPETAQNGTVLSLTYYKNPTALGVSLYPVTSSSLTSATPAWSANGITTMDTGSGDARGRHIWKAVLPVENDNGFLRLTANPE